MPQNASVPAETDTLCEHCGYGLNGLPTDGLCPECGQPIADSTTGDGRTLPTWETETATPTSRFIRTTRQIIFSPARFFRNLTTRAPLDRPRAFSNVHQWIQAVLLGATAALHFQWMLTVSTRSVDSWLLIIYAVVLTLLARALLWGITVLASFLSRVEGRYWGYRLPATAVRRVMYYHAAQMLPVATMVFVTVAGFRVLRATHILDGMADVKYLVVLSIEVLVAAAYLFRTYWIAMKNVMYANR